MKPFRPQNIRSSRSNNNDDFSEVYLKATVMNCQAPITETREHITDTDSPVDFSQTAESYKNQQINYTFKKQHFNDSGSLPLESEQSSSRLESEIDLNHRESTKKWNGM